MFCFDVCMFTIFGQIITLGPRERESQHRKISKSHFTFTEVLFGDGGVDERKHDFISKQEKKGCIYFKGSMTKK